MTLFRLSAHNVHTSGPYVETTEIEKALDAFRECVLIGRYRNVVLRAGEDADQYRGEIRTDDTMGAS